MYRHVTLHIPATSNRMRGVIRRPTSPWLSMAIAHETRRMSTDFSLTVPNIRAPNMSHAQEPVHVRRVSEMLRQDGILKTSLGFDDRKS